MLNNLLNKTIQTLKTEYKTLPAVEGIQAKNILQAVKEQSPDPILKESNLFEFEKNYLYLSKKDIPGITEYLKSGIENKKAIDVLISLYILKGSKGKFSFKKKYTGEQIKVSGVESLREQFKAGLLPDPLINYAEWAEEFFIMPPGSETPGRINLKFIPYSIEILENMSWTSPVKIEFDMKGVQLGFSTIFDIIIQAIVDFSPCPVLSFFGTDDLAIGYVKRRLEPAFENNPKIKGLIRDSYDKKGKSTHSLKIYRGGALSFVGGVSEANYREFSAAFVNMDDIDSFPRDVGGTEKRPGQGSPIDLAKARTNGRQGKYKMFVQGSPTDEETSLIYGEYKNTNKRMYFVPCPFCGHMQIIDFFRIRVKRDIAGNFKNEPCLECESCNKLIAENHKFSMMQLENGAKWMSTAESIDPLIVGRHLPSSYSLLGYSWVDMCKDWFKASEEKKRGNIRPMITFYNTKLGLPWNNNQSTKTISHTKLYNSREDYEVPEEAVIITAGCDVQVNRIEILVAGHNEEGHIYCLEHKVIGGNTLIKYGLQGSPFNDLEVFLKKNYKNAFGGDQPILHTALDMGYRSITASPFLQKVTQSGLEITGVYGSSVKAAKKKQFVGEPKPNKYDVDQREVNVNEGKTMVFNKLELGLVHFNKHPSFTDDLFRQFTVERFDEKLQAWVCPDHAKNEGFDMLNYLNAALVIYSGGGEIDWEDFKTWNKKGCKVNSSSNETFKIISNGANV